MILMALENLFKELQFSFLSKSRLASMMEIFGLEVDPQADLRPFARSLRSSITCTYVHVEVLLVKSSKETLMPEFRLVFAPVFIRKMREIVIF